MATRRSTTNLEERQEHLIALMRRFAIVELAAIPMIAYAVDKAFGPTAGLVAVAVATLSALYTGVGFRLVVLRQQRRRGVHERMLSEGPRSAEATGQADRAEESLRRLGRLTVLWVLWLLVTVVLPRFSLLAAAVAALVLMAAHYVYLRPVWRELIRQRRSEPRSRGARASAHRLVRGLALLWLAISVVLAVIISLDEFRFENMAVVAGALAIFAALWLGQWLLGDRSG